MGYNSFSPFWGVFCDPGPCPDLCEEVVSCSSFLQFGRGAEVGHTSSSGHLAWVEVQATLPHTQRAANPSGVAVLP